MYLINHGMDVHTAIETHVTIKITTTAAENDVEIMTVTTIRTMMTAIERVNDAIYVVKSAAGHQSTTIVSANKLIIDGEVEYYNTWLRSNNKKSLSSLRQTTMSR